MCLAAMAINTTNNTRFLMLTTATATPANEMSFPEFLEEALSRGSPVRHKQYSLDHGVDETALIRYANGAVSTYERSEVEAVLTKCDWARDFVVNLVKNKRVLRNAA